MCVWRGDMYIQVGIWEECSFHHIFVQVSDCGAINAIQSAHQ